jgi:acyl carrier protein
VSVDAQLKAIFKKVLDINPDEIEGDTTLDASLGIDSTELVEISVAIKKELNVPLKDGELKKSHTFNQIVKIVEGKS